MEEKKVSKEIDVIAIARMVLIEWKLLLKFIGVATIIGLVVALNSIKEYTTSVVLAPELSSGGLGMSESISDMAATFGFDIGTKSSYDAIYPEIYPDVFASTNFILTLFDVSVKQKNDSVSKSYFNHITQDARIPFWEYPKVGIGKLITFLTQNNTTSNRGINPFMLTRDQEGICNHIRNQISCKIDKKTSLITISITDFDPQVSAIMADTLQRRLQDYITDYRTKKARKDLEYYQELYNQSQKEYIKAQQDYASYADAYYNSSLEAISVKKERLENEMQIKFNIYSQAASQLQNAKAKVQANTPVFTTIQSSTVPNRASSTPRLLILLFFMFLGGMADVLWVLILKDYMQKRHPKT